MPRLASPLGLSTKAQRFLARWLSNYFEEIPMPRSRAFDAELVRAALQLIRKGASPYLAVEAAGLSRAQFRAWLALGKRERARKPYRELCGEFRQAKAMARVLKEIEQGNKDPKSWLLHGPGRETSSRRGWSTASKAETYRPAKTKGLTQEQFEEALRNSLVGEPTGKSVISRILLSIAAAAKSAKPPKGKKKGVGRKGKGGFRSP